MNEMRRSNRLRGLGMLPHQVQFIEQTLSLGPGARVVLADSVGLGKTTSLCALVAELDRDSNRPARVLVVASMALGLQWIARLSDDFGIDAIIMDSQRMRSLEATARPDQNLWLEAAKIVASPQFLMRDKRYRAVLAASWDLVVIEDVSVPAAEPQESPLFMDLWRCDHIDRVVVSVASADISGSIEPPPDTTFARNVTDLRDWDGRLLFQRTQLVESVVVSLTTEEADLFHAVRALPQRDTSADSVTMLRNRAASSLMALEQTLRRLLVGQLPRDAATSPDVLNVGTDVEPDSQPFVAKRITDQEMSQLLRLLENVPRDSKMAALVALVAGAERHSGPCIIFTDYRDTADYIVDQLQLAEVGRPVDSVVANRPPHETADAVRRTMEQNGALVATTAACKGFEFGSAALVVHYDVPLSPAGMTIRMSRVNRLTSPPGTVKVVSLTDEVFAAP